MTLKQDGGSDAAQQKFVPVLSQFCDAILEVDLEKGTFEHTLFADGAERFADTGGDYISAYEKHLDCKVDARDADTFRNMFDLNALRKAAADGGEMLSCRYRIRKNDGHTWEESRVLLPDGAGANGALIITRNVENETLSELRGDTVARYDAALRSIYDELFEINVSTDAFRLLHYKEGKFIKPPKTGSVGYIIGYSADKLIHPDDRQIFLDLFDVEKLRAYFAGGAGISIGEFRELWTDGEYHWTSISIFPAHTAEDGDEIYLCFVMDIDNKKKSNEIAEQNRLLKKQQMDNERYHIIVNRTDTLVFDWRLDTDERYVSSRLLERFNFDYRRGNLFDELREKVLHPDDVGEFARLYGMVTREHIDTDEIVRLLDSEGNYIWCKMTATTVLDETGTPRRIIVTINDVDEAERHRRELIRRAEYDALTGLYNMETFYEKAERMVRANPGRGHVVLRMDINRFKLVNDLYGFDEGDRLLQYAASAIRKVFSGRDAVYGRLNSDVFAICAAYARPDEVVMLMRKLLQEMEDYNIMGYKAAPSFGVCFAEDLDMPIRILCDRAGMAQKTIKGNMITRWAFYGDKLREQQIDERMLENCMEDALEKNEFVIYLQPKHEVKTGKIVGAEALVRWRHPQEGLMRPLRFIPLFERNGFIIKLDEYVWEQVCRIIKKWMDEGRTPVPVSMNVSRVHMFNHGFEERLLKMIRQYGVPEDMIELELTESSLAENEKELHHMMMALQKKGLHLSMDDFGAGYSSLNMLRNVPVQTIKLDKEFLSETTANEKGKIIMEHTISMVNNLDLNIVAEGVETAPQAEFLERAGCGVAQGYYYSRPMPVEDFEKLLFEGHPGKH